MSGIRSAGETVLPPEERYGVSVAETGAVGDGVADDAAAIQRGLDAGVRLVVVPPGVYKVGRTLRIRSGTRLVAHPRAVFVLADGAGADESCFLLANAGSGDCDADIEIMGGIWDGNNPANPRGADAPGSYTGAILNFVNVAGLRLRRMTLRDAEAYYVRVGEARDVVVEDLLFEAPHVRPNQDGVHFGGVVEDAVVRRLRATGPYCTADDMVALNADDNVERAQNLGMKRGPIRRVRIEDLRAQCCHTFVRLLSESAAVEDVEIRGVHGGCDVCAINLDGWWGFPDGAGNCARLIAEDLCVWRTRPGRDKPLLDIRMRMEDVRIRDFTRDASRDADPGSPTLALANLRENRAVLSGLSAAQAAAVRDRSRLAEARFLRQASPAATEPVRLECRTAGKDGRLVLPAGGFKELFFTAEPPGAPPTKK